MFKLILLTVVAACASDSGFETQRASDDAALDEEIAVQTIISCDGDGPPVRLKSAAELEECGFSLDSGVYETFAWPANRTEETTEENLKLDNPIRQKKITVVNERVPAQHSTDPSAQPQRDTYTFSAPQPGTGPQQVEELFPLYDGDGTRTAFGKLDILLVIDNSISMRGEIAKVKQQLSNLLSFVGNSDWQIKVIAVEPYQSVCLKGGVTKADPTSDTSYKSLIAAITLKGGSEYMTYIAARGLEGECPNQQTTPWLRPGSTVAVVLISDEPHHDYPLDTGSSYTTESFNSYLRTLRGHTVRVYGLTKTEGTVSSYNDIFDLWQDIDSADYDSVFTAISKDIKEYMTLKVELQKMPIAGTLNYKVGRYGSSGAFYGFDFNRVMSQLYKQPGDDPQFECLSGMAQGETCPLRDLFIANGRTVTLDYGYQPCDRSQSNDDYQSCMATQLMVVYEHTGVPFKYSWNINGHMPLAGSERVTITAKDGTVHSLSRDTHYTLSGSTITLTSAGQTLSTAGSSMSVSYKSDALLKTFALNTAKTPIASSVQVRVGGGQWTKLGFTYNASRKEITFSQAPAEKENVLVEYEYEKLKLRYYWPLDPKNTTARITCSQPCEHTAGNNYVTFTADDVSKDEEVTLTQNLTLADGDYNYYLPPAYIHGKDVVKVTQDSNTCINDSNKQELNIKTVGAAYKIVMYGNTASQCVKNKIDIDKEISVTYTIATDDKMDHFQMEKSFFEKYEDDYRFRYYRVYVEENGKEEVAVEDFEVDNYRIVLGSDLQFYDTTVRAEVYLFGWSWTRVANE